MYSREADVSKDISVWTTVLWLAYKRQLGKQAKGKYQPNDCLADPRKQPLFSCRQLGYEGATSGGAKLNQTITKIEAYLLSPTGPHEFASTLAPSVRPTSQSA
ncbi:hypothetical protein Tco_1300728 [Tanacetum coccineum]